MDKNLSLNEIRTRCSQFVLNWKNAVGGEKQEDQSFVRDLLMAFGITETKAALYQRKVRKSSTGKDGFIDALVPGILLFEMKSSGKSLENAEEQALDYIQHLTEAETPRYVLTCDFKKFRLLDIHSSKGSELVEFQLEDLPNYCEKLAFLAGYTTRSFGSSEQEEASVKAAKIMGGLYENLEGSGYSDHEASIFLVRVLFALYGDDAGLWQKNSIAQFIETRTAKDGSDLGSQLSLLFQVLNQPKNKRFSNLDELLMRFPYVNGGIFSETLTIPSFDSKMRDQLLKACAFDWSNISPAIFGSLFQAIKNSASRRKLGEHYTTEINIKKLIDPLFLDELRAELSENSYDLNGLLALRQKIGKMRFLDPACGCGNFLVVAYKEMRQLELEIVLRLQELGDENSMPTLFLDRSQLAIQLDSFAGIEIEEWPARIAETALRLAEHQADQILERALGLAPPILPLDTLNNIRVSNALRTNWAELLPSTPGLTSVIFGNPPFLGHISRESEQTEDLATVWDRKDIGRLDYVTAWYKLAIDTLSDRRNAIFAFVSTNSITQGEPVPALFKPIFAKGWRIKFAHRTFSWSSEAPGEAQVHCVIIGFDRSVDAPSKLFNYSLSKSEPIELIVPTINAYLVEGPQVFVEQSREILSPDLPSVTMGNMPRDGGHLLINTVEELRKVEMDPIAMKYVRKYAMGKELINNIPRWCFWLVDLEPSDLSKSPVLKERLSQVAAFRNESNAPSTRQMAATPHLFGQRSQPKFDYLAIPKVFSETRRWATVEYLFSDVIAGDKIYKCDDPDGLAFAIASSSMFITWQKSIGGRLKSDPSFSNTLVWNNLPIPSISPEVRLEVIDAGMKLLSLRRSYENSSLADLYNPLGMKPELIKAHAVLDKAVDFAVSTSRESLSDSQRERVLFDNYIKLSPFSE